MEITSSHPTRRTSLPSNHNLTHTRIWQFPTHSFLKPSLSWPLLAHCSRFSACLPDCFFSISLKGLFLFQLLNIGVPQGLLHLSLHSFHSWAINSYGFKFQIYRPTPDLYLHLTPPLSSMLTHPTAYCSIWKTLTLISLNQDQNRIVGKTPPIFLKNVLLQLTTTIGRTSFPHTPKSNCSKSYHF